VLPGEPHDADKVPAQAPASRLDQRVDPGDAGLAIPVLVFGLPVFILLAGVSALGVQLYLRSGRL
jgi:hypothetical protein